MGAYVIESTQGQDLLSDLAKKEGVSVAGTKADKKKVKQSEKRLKSLEEKISALASAENDEEEEDDAATAAPTDDASETDLPQSLAPPTTDEETVPTLQTFAQESTSLTQFQNLFKGCVFYLSREVPRYSLEFVIRAFGGEVGWPSTAGAGSPFEESDPKITHQIVDRPPVNVDAQSPNAKGVQGEVKRYDKREYLQPQWVYDSVNARRLVKSEGYRQGETLPPHLSPFVVAKDGEYVPEEAGGEPVDMDVDADEEMAEAEGGVEEEEEDEETAVADEDEEKSDKEEQADVDVGVGLFGKLSLDHSLIKFFNSLPTKKPSTKQNCKPKPRVSRSASSNSNKSKSNRRPRRLLPLRKLRRRNRRGRNGSWRR